MPTLDNRQASQLEEQYDPEFQFRRLSGPTRWLVVGLLVILSAFHYYTSGFGVLTHHWHTGIHLAFVLGLIFLVFPANRNSDRTQVTTAWWYPGGVPLYDWLFFLTTLAAALYIAATYTGVDGVLEPITFRIGNPVTLDVVMGTLMILIVLETTRRSMGYALPVTCLAFLIYGLWGNYAPGPLVHPGNHWPALIDHLYMTGEGVFGLPVVVVATYVFHFVLFGVIASKIGLGQLFIDISYCIAGRYAGGNVPRKFAKARRVEPRCRHALGVALQIALIDMLRIMRGADEERVGRDRPPDRERRGF
jgi:TRAP-type uncharacterized transport system fused permease subunit